MLSQSLHQSTPFPTHPLLSSVLLHHQDLNHSDKDVEEVELKRDGLVDRITLNHTSLSETGVVEHLLDVVQSEATKDSQTTIQPDTLGEGKSADGSGGDDQGSEARDSNDGGTSQKRTTNVEVLLLLSSGTHDGQSAHHGNSVETSAGEQRHGDKGKQRSDKSGLSSVEGGPESVLGDVAVDTKRLATDRHTNNVSKSKTYLSGLIDRVPIMVAKLRAKPPIPTTQGFVTISRYTKPV